MQPPPAPVSASARAFSKGRCASAQRCGSLARTSAISRARPAASCPASQAQPSAELAIGTREPTRRFSSSRESLSQRCTNTMSGPSRAPRPQAPPKRSATACMCGRASSAMPNPASTLWPSRSAGSPGRSRSPGRATSTPSSSMVWQSRQTVGCGSPVMRASSEPDSSGRSALKQPRMARPRASAATNWRSRRAAASASGQVSGRAGGAATAGLVFGGTRDPLPPRLYSGADGS